MKIQLDQDAQTRLHREMLLALQQTGLDVIGDIEEALIVPKALGILEGTLRPLDISDLSDGIVRIHSDTPYARRLYYNPDFNFHREPWEGGEGNANAQAFWFEPWIRGNRADWLMDRFRINLKEFSK